MNTKVEIMTTDLLAGQLIFPQTLTSVREVDMLQEIFHLGYVAFRVMSKQITN